jgi:hypothetical protein
LSSSRVLATSNKEIRYEWLKKVNEYEVTLNEIQDRFLESLDTEILSEMYEPLVIMTTMIYRNHYLHAMPMDSVNIIPHELASYVIGRFSRSPGSYQIFAWYKIVKTYLLRFKDEYLRDFNPHDHACLDSFDGKCSQIGTRLGDRVNSGDRSGGLYRELTSSSDSDSDECLSREQKLEIIEECVRKGINKLGSLVGATTDSLTRNLIKLHKETSIKSLLAIYSKEFIAKEVELYQ